MRSCPPPTRDAPSRSSSILSYNNIYFAVLRYIAYHRTIRTAKEQPVSDRYPRALGVSYTLLSVMRVLNLLAGAILAVSFLASFAFEPVFLDFFSKVPSRLNSDLLIGALRFWMILALPMVAA